MYSYAHSLIILLLVGGIYAFKLNSHTRYYSTKISEHFGHVNMVSSSSSSSSSDSFAKIDSSYFAHPNDIKVTKQLENIPFLEPLIRRALYTAETVYFTELLSSAVLVSTKQYPNLHTSLVNVSSLFKMQTIPELFIVQNPIPNAYTLAIRGRKPFIVVHSSLLQLLTEQEVKAVLGHEIGHLVCEHSVWVTMANVLLLGLGNFLPPAIVRSLQSQLFEWLRYAELSCDRAAFLAVKDLNIVLSMMIKLSGGSAGLLTEEFNVEEYLKQGDLYKEELKKNAFIIGAISGRASQQRTHPVPVLRAKELAKWVNSGQYAGLVARKSIRESV